MRTCIPHSRLGVAITATLALCACGGGGYGGEGGTAPPTTGTVTGQVTVDASPRAGAVTHLRAVGTGTDARPAQTTNATGSYTFTLVPPGEYRVFADLPDTLAADPGPAEDTVTVVAGATAPAATFQLRLLVGGVTGVVIDDVGTALGGRSVFLRRQGSVSERSTTTGGDGSYAFASVTVGTYIVRVATVCGEPAARTDTLAVVDGVQAQADTIPVTPRTSDVLFSCDVQPIFTANCALSGCHGTIGTQPPGKPMALTSGQAYGNIVNIAALQPTPSMDRIEPGQPDNSYLVHKIQGTQATVGGSGERMPFGCTTNCLSQAQIDLIRLWVTEGALNN